MRQFFNRELTRRRSHFAVRTRVREKPAKLWRKHAAGNSKWPHAQRYGWLALIAQQLKRLKIVADAARAPRHFCHGAQRLIPHGGNALRKIRGP